VEILDRYIFDVANVQAMLRLSTPVALAGLSALVTSRAGMINIAAEGIINLCTFAAVAGAFFSRSTSVGIMSALLTGLVAASFFALFSIKFRADLIIMGIAINIFAVSTTMFLCRVIFQQAGAFTDPSIAGLQPIHIPVLEDLRILGPILSGHSPLTYAVWALIPITRIFLYRTRWGLRLRAVGEAPQAAETLGVDVQLIRFAAIVASGFFAALAGVYLSLSHLRMYTDGMAAGRGFLGLTANIFGNQEPIGVFLSSLLFGLVESIGWRMQADRLMPVQFINMLPYLATMVMLTTSALRSRQTRKNALERAAKKSISDQGDPLESTSRRTTVPLP
jgi:simple sugar transport system permease protein